MFEPATHTQIFKTKRIRYLKHFAAPDVFKELMKETEGKVKQAIKSLTLVKVNISISAEKENYQMECKQVKQTLAGDTSSSQKL